MKTEDEIVGFKGEKLSVKQIMLYGAILETGRKGGMIRYQGNVYSVSEKTVNDIKAWKDSVHHNSGRWIVPKIKRSF